MDRSQRISGRRGVVTAFCLGLAGTLLASASHAGSVPLAEDSFTAPVQSVFERRFARVVHQQYDFSCGSAAVATLLTYSYDRPVPEQATFRAMYQHGDQAAIRKVGFSLLDMKTYLAAQGIRSDGYRVPLQKLRAVGIPAITLIKTHGYNHFVVIRGVTDDEVLIADPAQGLRRAKIADFEPVWSGASFLIKDMVETAHAHFNDPRDWALVPGAPVERGMDRDRLGIGSLYLNQPLGNEF